METGLIELLGKIQRAANADLRIELIRAFQNQVWSMPREAFDTEVGRVLEDLAADLDYYESDPAVRRAAQLHDEQRLREDIDRAIAHLHKLGFVPE